MSSPPARSPGCPWPRRLCPDGDLVAAFTDHRDEAAFAELVRRHGAVVRAACRRMLPNPPDADDAFQATFLVLARRGPGLDPAQPLGPWLYRVAVLTSRTLRRGNARRFARLEAPPPAGRRVAPADTADLRIDLDAALLALPEKYRTPLVLCHLQGWSRRDAAEQLGCREGTLSSLLARGLTKLKARLRGYDPTAALVAAPPRSRSRWRRRPPAPPRAWGRRRPRSASPTGCAAGVGGKAQTAAGVLVVMAAAGYGFVAAAGPPAGPAAVVARSRPRPRPRGPRGGGCGPGSLPATGSTCASAGRSGRCRCGRSRSGRTGRSASRPCSRTSTGSRAT